MNIQEMLDKIKREEPLEIDEMEESTKLLRLSDEDIKQLVDFSIRKQPQVRLLPSGKTVDLLTKLMCMGTAQDPSRELISPSNNKDKYIGYKDSRIERYIIQKAIEKAGYRKKNAREEAILGLSANPPTINHGLYIQHLMKIYSTLHVIINAQSPLKQGYHSRYPSGEARLDLLNTMLKSEGILRKEPQLVLDTLEIDRDPPSRTIATLALLLLKANDTPNYSLILGLDGLFSFTRWYRWEDFAKLCEIKIYPRSGIHYTQETMRKALERLVNNGQKLTLVANSLKLKTVYDAVCKAIDNKLLTCTFEEIGTFEGSATDVRKFYRNENNVGQKHPNISESVHELVIKRGYYTQDTL